MADEKLLGRFEMLWDCGFCGKTKLLAITHRHCPECGATQDQTKRYFPSDEDKVAVKDDYAGADRVCASCSAPNGAKATFCVQCGAPVDEAAAAKKRADQVVKDGQKFAADDALKAEVELSDKAHMEGSGAPKPKPVMAVKKRSYTWLYVLLVVAGLFFLIWFACIRKKSVDVQVEGQHWTKTIAIEEYKEVQHEDWQDSLPSDRTRTGNCRDKQADSRQVPDGQDCNVRRRDKGDGTFEEVKECTPKYRSEPIYKTWCTYWRDEWTQVDTAKASADDGAEPAWPVTGIKPATIIARGSRREGKREEVFTVDLKDKGNHHYHCDVAKDLWSKLKKGTAAKASVRSGTGAFVCGDLKAK